MTKIIAIVTLTLWNPATGTIDEASVRFGNVGVNIAQCERTVEMDSFWLAVDAQTVIDQKWVPVAGKAECVVWREA